MTGRRSRSAAHAGRSTAHSEQPPLDAEAAARALCLRLLTQRARSRHELALALTGRDVPDDVIERVLDRFAAVGLIDDAALAEAMAGAQHRERGLAGRAVAFKLRQRGLADELVASAVAAIGPDEERERAEVLVRRRQRSLAGLPEQIQRRRLVAMLGRKGYSPALAYEVVRATMGDDDGQFDPPDDLTDS